MNSSETYIQHTICYRLCFQNLTLYYLGSILLGVLSLFSWINTWQWEHSLFLLLAPPQGIPRAQPYRVILFLGALEHYTALTLRSCGCSYEYLQTIKCNWKWCLPLLGWNSKKNLCVIHQIFFSLLWARKLCIKVMLQLQESRAAVPLYLWVKPP